MRAFLIICTMLLINTNLLANSKYKIAVLYWSMNIAGQVAMREGLENEAKEINKLAKKSNKKEIEIIPFVAGDGQNGIENQIKQFDKALSINPDIIIIQPTDNAGLANSLLKANKLNIPVVAYDQNILQGKLKSFLTSNNYMAGFLGGEYISSLYKDDEKIKIVIVDYPYVSSTVDRVNGFIDALEQYNQQYKILKTYQAVEPIGGKEAGEKILRDFPNKYSIDVIFSVNDGGGVALVDTLYKAKRIEIKHATVDGDAKSIENIKNNHLTVIDSAQFCAPLGKESLKVAMNILNNKKVADTYLIPVFPITKETLHLYKDWYEIPKEFEKPWSAVDSKWSNKIEVK